jgi:hypothetical protein
MHRVVGNGRPEQQHLRRRRRCAAAFKYANPKRCGFGGSTGGFTLDGFRLELMPDQPLLRPRHLIGGDAASDVAIEIESPGTGPLLVQIVNVAGVGAFSWPALRPRAFRVFMPGKWPCRRYG